MAEVVSLSVREKYKAIWARFRAKHPRDASPIIMELIEKHVKANSENYPEVNQIEHPAASD